MKWKFVLVFILYGSCQSFFERPTQTNKTNNLLFETNKQEHPIKHFKQVEQIQLPNEQKERQELETEVSFQHVKLDIKENSKKQEFLVESPQVTDEIYINKQRIPPNPPPTKRLLFQEEPDEHDLTKIHEIAQIRKPELEEQAGWSKIVRLRERESETFLHHHLISSNSSWVKISQNKGESKGKVSRVEKDKRPFSSKISSPAHLSDISKAGADPKPSSAKKITKLSSGNSSTYLLYSLYLGLPATLLLLLALFLAAYFYRPTSDVGQVYILIFLISPLNIVFFASETHWHLWRGDMFPKV